MGGELAKGVGTLVTAPIRGAAERGVGGFFSGVGKGLVGAVSAPVKGILRTTEAVSQGVASEAVHFSNMGKSKIELLNPRTVRVREGRRFDLQGRFKNYDENVATVGYILRRLQRTSMRPQQLRHFAFVPSVDELGAHTASLNLLMLTTDFVILMPVVSF